MLRIRRLRCVKCRRMHHELPDFIVPHKHYAARSIEQALRWPHHHTVSCENSTVYRWKKWIEHLMARHPDAGIRHCGLSSLPQSFFVEGWLPELVLILLTS